MLTEIAAMLAAKMQIISMFSRKLDLEKTVKNLIGEKSDIIVFVLNKDGRVLSVDTYLENSDRPGCRAQMDGRQYFGHSPPGKRS